jgi:hypothetical protein
MTTIEENFRTLDLVPGASLDQIKQAYRDLVQIWHPDRFQHSPRLRRKAEERLKEINASFEKLVSFSRGSGWHETPPAPPRQEPQPPPADAKDGAGTVPPSAARSDTFTEEQTNHRWGGLLSLIGGILLIGISFRDPGQNYLTRETSESSAPIPKAERVFDQQENTRSVDLPPTSTASLSRCDPTAFAEDFVRALGSDDVEKPLAFYADTVTYFGKQRSRRESIRIDLEKDIKKWSGRIYTIIKGPDAWAVEDGWGVEFIMRCAVSNAQGTKNGTLAMEFRLGRQGQSFKITEIHAEKPLAHRVQPREICRKRSSVSLWDRFRRLMMPPGRSSRRVITSS